MRGHLSPSIKAQITDAQKRFQTLSRARRSKLAKVAQTTLLKADRWAHGGQVASEVAEAIERALSAAGAKKK